MNNIELLIKMNFKMRSLGSILEIGNTYGPIQREKYNLLPSLFADQNSCEGSHTQCHTTKQICLYNCLPFWAAFRSIKLVRM